MEKVCEFCTGSRPIVYCKADGAYLCLSCDSKVHSANALSGRHLRNLLCDSCKHYAAHVWCLDHRRFMCPRCDKNLHNSISEHQKRSISGYMGCPSSKDLATLWGLNINDLERSSSQESFVPSPRGSMFSRSSSIDRAARSRVNREPLVSRAHSKVGQGSQYRELLDLKKLQLTEGDNPSPVLHGKERINMSIDENLDQSFLLKDSENSSQHSVSQGQDLKMVEPLSFPLLEHLPSSSATESFWQCRSPGSSQLWSQNMEDIGICEEPIFEDNFDIPDMDLTFRNFEETFESEENPNKTQSDYVNASCSSLEKNLCIDKPDNHFTRITENAYLDSSANSLKNDRKEETWFHSHGADVAQTNDAENAVAGHKVKKARLHQNQLQYRSVKARAELRKQKKERLMKKDECNSSDNVDVAQRC